MLFEIRCNSPLKNYNRIIRHCSWEEALLSISSIQYVPKVASILPRFDDFIIDWNETAGRCT